MSFDPAEIGALFAENFSSRGELGASVSIWRDGREMLSLSGGYVDRSKEKKWTAETPVLVWSATKGPAAACVLHAMQENGVPLSTRVSRLWPQFGQNGKEAITLAMLLSHQAGLVALDVLDAPAPILDYGSVVAALARQQPLWPPGFGHGYHARTFGFLLDEVVRRLTGGVPLGRYWQQAFAEPLGLDFWIGLPADRIDSAATVYPARSGPPADAFQAALADPASLTARAFASPAGLNRVSAMNSAEARTASLPALGGIGSARALGRFYAMLAACGRMDGRIYFGEEALGWMKTPLVSGPDKVLRVETSFSAGFMKDPVAAGGTKSRMTFGPSAGAFGHPGAGGSLGFADPESNTAFAYVMNQMEPGVMSNPKAARIVEALYS